MEVFGGWCGELTDMVVDGYGCVRFEYWIFVCGFIVVNFLVMESFVVCGGVLVCCCDGFVKDSRCLLCGWVFVC